MKVANTMFQSLVPLCLILLPFITKQLQAAEPEPVVDKQGNPLEAGVGYYVWPLWGDNGGLTLSQTRNKTCPLNVIRNPDFIGSPLTLFAPNHDHYVPTETDLTIGFNVKNTICNQATTWKLLKEGSGFWFISTGGESGELTSKFKIERLSGEHAYEIYSFKFCPSVPGVLCAPVGTYTDADGTKVMAVGDDIETYYVRFQRVDIIDQKKGHGFNSA